MAAPCQARSRQARLRPPLPIVRERLRRAGYRLFPRTLFGPAVVACVRRGDDVIRVLNVGGAYQTATFLDDRRFDLVFPYYRAFDLVFQISPPARRILAIGAGGCAWPKHAVHAHLDVHVDAVEIDPAIVEIARELFFVSELETTGRLRLIVADGLTFLESCDVDSYDAIVVDAFAGARDVPSLGTAAAAHAAKRALRPGGLFLANAVSRSGGDDVSLLAEAIDTFSQVFTHAYAIPCVDEGFSREDNYLLVATDGARGLGNALSVSIDAHAFPKYAAGADSHG